MHHAHAPARLIARAAGVRAKIATLMVRGSGACVARRARARACAGDRTAGARLPARARSLPPRPAPRRRPARRRARVPALRRAAAARAPGHRDPGLRDDASTGARRRRRARRSGSGRRCSSRWGSPRSCRPGPAGRWRSSPSRRCCGPRSPRRARSARSTAWRGRGGWAACAARSPPRSSLLAAIAAFAVVIAATGKARAELGTGGLLDQHRRARRLRRHLARPRVAAAARRRGLEGARSRGAARRGSGSS